MAYVGAITDGEGFASVSTANKVSVDRSVAFHTHNRRSFPIQIFSRILSFSLFFRVFFGNNFLHLPFSLSLPSRLLQS
jgi:hypothetical protein